MKRSNKIIIIIIIILCAGFLSCSNSEPELNKIQPETHSFDFDFNRILTEAGIYDVVPTESATKIQETSESEQETEETTEITTKTTTEDLIYKYIVVPTEPPPAPTSNPPAVVSPPPATIKAPAALTTEALLRDFDYLAKILEENYPFYGAARRKFGVDLHLQTAAARAVVEKLDTSGSDSQILSSFADILASYIINPVRSMGHMTGYRLGSSSHKIQLALIKQDGGYEIQSYPNMYGGYLHDMFTSPEAVRYYGDPFRDSDVESFIKSALQTPVPNNVTCQIIRPEEVAYIQMSTMNSANFTVDRAIIADFVETVGDFGHLIIDLRGNRGGYAGNFTYNIMAPLIDKPASLFYYVFFKGGDHNLMFDDFYYRDLKWQAANGLRGFLGADAPVSVGDILPALTNANADDFAGLDYGFKRELKVEPSAARWKFNGRIWILIDGRSISAAEISALLAKESGFATIVGTPTGGMFGGYTAAFVGLPNTGAIVRYDYGYVTDLRGRSIEELGVAPDIYNRPGMDALETVLALIDEGDS